ncbi:MAG: molybdate ABC transporter substrate-binding protein [Myxococcales bacterium]|nr:molybdate ABC transporter substrate-binding protein [Myxococcales bacterium]MCB9580829.1 molybdate ABC transporter substrate-binding protein [Polyangiaceae bacterium]
MLLKCAALIVLLSCQRDKTELSVFAAASLSDALTTIGKSYENEHPKTHVAFSFGGSNQMARQLIASPKADIFVSASEAWMDRVPSVDTRVDLLENHLVVVVKADSPLKIDAPSDLQNAPHLVLANPEAVPAGIYAKQWLTSEKLWDRVKDHVLPMPDVRAALGQVRRGKDLVGIVYASDARSTSDVRVVLEVRNGPRIRYPAALLRGHQPEAQQLFDYLRGPEARRVFESQGFVPLEGD